MKKLLTARQAASLLGFFLFLGSPVGQVHGETADWLESVSKGPSVLVIYDGPAIDSNPGKLDAGYLANLLGHFTTRRTMLSLSDYKSGDLSKYDAVFAIIYQKKFRVPDVFLKDIAAYSRSFCWLGNQVGQLDRVHMLARHGIRFEKFAEDSPARQVIYKNKLMGKGDPDTNLFEVVDPSLAATMAEAVGANNWRYPYILKSGNFWIVADSPFSYSGENDRYIAFADVLHDILGINHPEVHRAMLRIEDINPTSEPADLQGMLDVVRALKIPFAFGFVPFYVNPTQHQFIQMSEKPDVVAKLKSFVRYGGQPVLHGDTHQYRGVTTDDYEFWDNITDRPVRRDSEDFALRRVEDALKESVSNGLYPVTWETPHYAASKTDYRVFRRIFNTVYERRLTSDRLGTDQFFPYPVIDLTGQYVVPECMGYIQESNAKPDDLLASAEANLVIRDGYASFFFHPFLKPELLKTVLKSMQKMGYRFVSLSGFPNCVRDHGYLATNISGSFDLAGEGRYVTELRIAGSGSVLSESTREVSPRDHIKLNIDVGPNETFVAVRHAVKPANLLQRLVRVAKGDVSALNQKWESIFAPSELPENRSVVLLWNDKATGEEAVDQRSFESMLLAVGYDVSRLSNQTLTGQDLGDFAMLVVPASAARRLSKIDIDRIVHAVDSGILLVTDGDSPLSRAVGFDLGEPIRVGYVENRLYTAQELRWSDRPLVPWIEHVSPDNDEVLFAEREGNKALAVNRALGEGQVLFFAPYFDSLSGDGYSRFPDVPYMLVNDFRVRPLLKRTGAEAYFDPGYRQNISIEQLAKIWRKFGIRVIHVGAWHFYDKYAYDYERLIRVAHENGILVYAWFEWPHVSQKFWNQHPEWREKNALLTDAKIDWRYLMNFQDPRCFKDIMTDAKKMLTDLDWDGVNIAEFHFESGSSPSDKMSFTPLNPQMRQSFEKAYGYDPLELWKLGSPHEISVNPQGLQDFYSYRKQTNLQLLARILAELQSINAKPGKSMEFVLTMFDIDGHPELSDRLGVDAAKTLELINRNDITLQVEDPASEWSKAPERYASMGERYRRKNLRRPFMIDINVLDVHSPNQPGFATRVQSGTELLQLWRAASTHTSRICMYSESSINEGDWELLPYAMAADASVAREGDEWVVKTEDTVELELPRPIRRVFLDGRPWFVYANRSMIIPPGEHRVRLQPGIKTWIDTTPLDTRLITLSGELLGSEPEKRGLEIEYRSVGRCALLFNKQPYDMYIDESSVKLPVLKGDDGYVVLAPPGQHHLRVYTDSLITQIVDYTSVVSASLIVLFGATSSGLLFLLFIIIKLSRRARPVHRKIRDSIFPSPGSST